MKKIFVFIIFLFILAMANIIYAGQSNYRGKKILYVNSYHQGYDWSDGEQRGAEVVLSGTGVVFKAVYMDTKDNTSEQFCKMSGLKVKKIIEEFKPDVLIVADDNAFTYVIKPYYRDVNLPVVFCGINWDISTYGAPYKNTTGMIEIGLIEQLYNHLRKFSKGGRVGFVGYDAPHERRNVAYYDQYIENKILNKVFVKDFDSWKSEFLRLQEKSDMIIFGAHDGIKGWDSKEAANFIYVHIRIPTGSDVEGMTLVSLIGLTKSAEEQGEYAARAALRILDGARPADIPIVTNKKGLLSLNLHIAGKLGIVFTPAMFKVAKELIGQEQ